MKFRVVAAVVGTAWALSACGGPSDTQKNMQSAWASIDIEEQYAVCDGWHNQPKIIESALLGEIAAKGYTASDVHALLAGECK